MVGPPKGPSMRTSTGGLCSAPGAAFLRAFACANASGDALSSSREAKRNARRCAPPLPGGAAPHLREDSAGEPGLPLGLQEELQGLPGGARDAERVGLRAWEGG